jgi:hypothetical protein
MIAHNTRPRRWRHTCRVCGLSFPATRPHAFTCTDTCRQRLKRGQAFAYFASLSKDQQRAERRYHDAVDAHFALAKASVAATREYRDLKRAQRQEQADREQERAKREREREWERIGFEIVGRGVIAEQKKQREQAARSAVASVLMLFAKERRNDMSAEAIAELINMPDDYPLEGIALALDQLRASGDYDRIVNEAAGAEGDA